MVHGEDKWIKDLGGEFIGSAGIALVAFLLTLPLIDWIFPSNPEYLGWNCAAASVFVAFVPGDHDPRRQCQEKKRFREKAVRDVEPELVFCRPRRSRNR